MLKLLIKKLRTLFAKKTLNAAQAWQASNAETYHAFWIYASPVNMLLGRDSYFLTDPASISVSEQESAALIDSLNTHFDQLGFTFYLQDNVWFLGLDKHPNITTTCIEDVKNQDIANHLPEGNGALDWNKLQNEIQMLLFSHPVNQAREAKGQPVINSLWCYGLGENLNKKT